MTTTDNPATTRLELADVLYDEYAQLRAAWWTPEAVRDVIQNVPARHPKEDPHTTRVAALYWLAHRPPDGQRLAALCLSGGGIRSATFNLGVIQALAGAQVLDRFDYLSSVSGGGYVASWLQGWLHRAGGLANIRDDLQGPRHDPLRPEARAIRHLREYSNYLTPQVGLLSLDTWTSVAIVARNIFLNWLVLLPLLAAVIALPLLAIAPSETPFLGTKALCALGFVAAMTGLVFMNALRGVTREEGFASPLPVDDAVPTPSGLRHRLGKLKDRFVLLGLAPLLVGVACIVTAVRWADLAPFAGSGGFATALRPSAIFGLVLSLASFLIAIPVQKLLTRDWPGAIPVDLFALTLAGAVQTLAFAFMLSHWATAVRDWPYHAYFIVAPALVLAPMLVGKSLFVAFSSLAEGNAEPPTASESGWSRWRARWAEWSSRPSQYGDAQREWWARWSAWICIALVTWTAGSAVAYLTPWVIHLAQQRFDAALAKAGGGAAFLGGLISYFGKSALTPAKNGKASSWTQLALNLAVPLFCLLVAMLISYGTQALIADLGDVENVRVEGDTLVRTIVTLIGFGLVMGWFVNVNRFSLQAFYRNRLVRCYLGASNVRVEGTKQTGRRPNLFTGFDPDDNVRLADLAANRPLPVVNMALNLVGGGNLAWQERKADSFTASPLHCGNAALGYRRTEIYGGDHGMSLGTAVAISGAAANPNMGYNSSPAVAFVMTLFNARLGAWFGNPGKPGDRTCRYSGPGLTSPYWMLAEAFGGTDETKAFVNLSDGGHFDNLGLYEMVRRRCGFILVCDAGQDGECRFDDLGAAIRKVRIDFGVSIQFERGIQVFPKTFKDRDARAGYAAIGHINYGDVDPGAPRGTLIYLKPAICENGEPYDVYNYARASKEFPHETTADQWFSESQFEAYRILGKTAMEAIMGKRTAFDGLEEFHAAVEKYLDDKRA